MKKRYEALDGLRFVLASMIIILHVLASYKYGTDLNANISIFGFPFYLKPLSRAVDVFFVLSGFTMVYSTLNPQPVLTFLQKRFARIFPLYVIVTIIAVLIFSSIPFLDSEPRKYTLDFILNSLILRPTNQVFPVVVAWTLAFEVVFYAIFAICMKISHQYRVVLATLFLGFFMLITIVFKYNGFGYFGILMDSKFLFLEFIAGMWLGLYADKIKMRNGWIFCIFGMIAMYMLIHTRAYASNYRGLYFVLPALLIVFGAITTQVPKFALRLTRKFGSISYTMYIIHVFTAFTFPIVLRKVLKTDRFSIILTAMVLLLTVIFSIIVHKYVEKPLYNYFTKNALHFKRPEKLLSAVKRHKKLTLLLVIASLFCFDLCMTKLLDNRPTWNVGRVISSKGSAEEIEHTFAAYDLAIKYGTQYIEPDVVLSKEGTLYVSTYLSAQKLTGVNKLFSQMTDEEIDGLRISNKFTTQSLKILKLQDVFDRYKNSVNYVIDLKENVKQVPSIIKIIKQNKLEKKIIIQSSKIEALNKLETSFPLMRKMFHVANAAELNEAVKQKHADIIGIHKSLMSEENIQFVHQNKKQISVWTLNTSDEIQRAIQLGVDSYFTEYTGKAILFEKEKVANT